MSYGGGGMDEIQRLILQVEGQADIAKLNDLLQKQKQRLDEVTSTYQVLAISGQGYELVEEKVAKRTQLLTHEQESLNRALKQTSEGTRGFGNTLTQTGYIVDDFVAGLNNQGLAGALANIQNNIPGFVASLGGPAGVAAVVGVAGVAVAQLVRHWSDLKGLWSDTSAADAAVAAEKRIEAAAKSATAAIDDQINALRKAETAGKGEQAEIVKAAIGEAGGVDDVVNATRAKMLAESPEVRKATENVGATYQANSEAAQNPANPMAQLRALVAIRKAERERDEATKQVEDATKDLVTRAARGDADAIRELDRLNPGGAFGQALPENIRAQDQEVQAVQDQGEAMHKAGVKRRKASGLVDDLNRAGQENEAALGRQGQADAADDLKKSLKSLELPNVPEPPEVNAFRERQAAARNMNALEQQASDIANQMAMGDMMGFDTSGLQQQLNLIQQQYTALQMKLSRQAGGQVGGGQFSALPMYEGGGN